MHIVSKTLLPAIGALLVIGGSLIGGVYIGYQNRPEIEKIKTLINKGSEVTFSDSQTDFSPFWKAWNVINEKYVPANGTTTVVTDQEKVWGAIKGLVASLEDPYSVFLPPADTTTFEENISGNFGGVGIEIGIRKNVLTVISPLKNTPAYRAGILTGDMIIKINDKDAYQMTIDDAVRNIRGEIGTAVLLTIMREEKNDPIEFKLVREVIAIPTIDTENRDDGVFVIKLYNFGATSGTLFREALRSFVLSGKTKLVFDLRGNAGGFLEAAVDIASWFLPAGKIIVTEDFGGKKGDTEHRSRGYDIFNENLDMVILVNQGTASASEIVSGALSEHGIATLVGEKTFGKGSVQELAMVTQDTSLKITIAHWKTPGGRIISKEGITPSIEVKITDDDRKNEKDPQFDKAVELLLKN